MISKEKGELISMTYDNNVREVLPFIFGGNCECIIKNESTGNEFQYSIKIGIDNKNQVIKRDGCEMYFVHVKGSKGYVYAGYILLNMERGQVKYVQGKNGKVASKEISIRALLYVITHYRNLPNGVKVLHVGRCSRCGRQLTDEASVMRGLGPKCYELAVRRLRKRNK